MATRSEKGAAIAGILVALASLFILLYKAAGPLLADYDTWEVAAIAAAPVVLIAAAAFVSFHLRRRQIARRIRRR
jgi:hypothetical protein